MTDLKPILRYRHAESGHDSGWIPRLPEVDPVVFRWFGRRNERTAAQEIKAFQKAIEAKASKRVISEKEAENIKIDMVNLLMQSDDEETPDSK